MSCCAERHASAMSGRPAGARGMNRLPSAASSIAAIATGPTPQRRVDRVARTAPMNEDAPPTPATIPTSAALTPSSSMANRNHVAPKIPQRPASSICAPANVRRMGSWRTSRRPCRISSSTGSRSSRGGGGASWVRTVSSRTADTTYVTASMRIVIGPVRRVTRMPLTPNPANSAAEPLAASALLASRSRSRSTIVGR